MSCLQSFTTEEILSIHKKQCLINGCQAVNYESGIIKFTNYNEQIIILFKICWHRMFFEKNYDKNIQQNIKNINLIL